MLEGVSVTAYGREVPGITRLATIGGSVLVAAAAETPLTVASANEYGYLVYMRADCTVASTTAGTWTLRIGVAGAVVLILQQPIVAAVVGASYCWPFPVPWKTTAQGGQFTIQPSVATMGSWQFFVNGFCSSV